MEEKVTILNRGKRTYQLKGGKDLKSGASATVDGAEAKLLLDQRDLADASKILPPSPDQRELEEANKKLQEANESLRKSLDEGGDELLKENVKLNDKVAKLEKEVADLKKAATKKPDARKTIGKKG